MTCPTLSNLDNEVEFSTGSAQNYFKAREDVSSNLSVKKLRHKIVRGHDILNTRVDIGYYRLRQDVPVLLPKRTGRKWKQFVECGSVTNRHACPVAAGNIRFFFFIIFGYNLFFNALDIHEHWHVLYAYQKLCGFFFFFSSEMGLHVTKLA